ncbi:M23 family metallopeptidase, partial [Azohydromonas lata]|uniref:M23 family metallopeptidase n=1 Tax=Azohydromonas lata TaxID=45677 RepID=UPI000A420F13
MLISPPFLPPRGDLTEEQWLNVAMACGGPGAGAYPVSANFDWHGGVHLTAPLNGTTPEPVRAIADGTVVFVREPTKTNDSQHPLCYGGGYTSDGTIIIRHETEIGINNHGQTTSVQFYSIYHHLYSIRTTARQNQPIWRKDELGQAGYIYGQANLIHFEIRCDEENLRKLIGRISGSLPVDRDGRLDAVFGEIYFYLPIDTPIYSQRPLLNSAVAQKPAPAGTPLPATPIALQPLTRTTDPMVIGMRYAGGIGESGRRGDVHVTSYTPQGIVVGSPIIESGAEYKIHESCATISKSYKTATQPAPSAIMEILRFGRIIGPDTLLPADLPHWREIPYTNGKGWVNLNAANVRKFSDADFPQWKKWRLITDNVNNDAHCDSQTLKSLIDLDGDGEINPIEGLAALREDHIAHQMHKTICKIPCEWNAENQNKRWKWLIETSARNTSPMEKADYDKFIEHVTALSIAHRDLFSKEWAFNPKAFIEVFRKCNW